MVPLRIGLLSEHDPYDRNSFSGTVYYMRKALESSPEISLSVFSGYKRWRLRRRWSAATALANCKMELSRGAFDWVVGPVSSGALDALHGASDVPFAHVTDATPCFLREFYGYDVPVSADECESSVIQNAARVIYSSEYMRGRAVGEFGSEFAGKLHVATFGLNLSSLPREVCCKPSMSPVSLLFIGKEWERKGGPVALGLLDALLRRGIDARLTIIGSAPAAALDHRNVEMLGFLNKNRARDYRRMTSALASAHFLVLPTIADCTPMVIAEANAFGTPVLVSDVGGIPSIVSNGDNGFMFPLGATGNDYAERVTALMGSPELYADLSRRAYEHCRERLTWDAWARGIVKILREGDASAGISAH